MTEPEQPEQPQLTRKQMRQIRNTAATQIIPPGAAPAPESVAPEGEAHTDDAAQAEREDAAEQAPAVPLPRAAEPVEVPPAPAPDSAVDLGVSPLTRRQARQQERIRTASVPVITPDVAAAHAATNDSPAESDAAPADADSADSTPAPSAEEDADDADRPLVAPSFGSELLAGEPVAAAAPASFDQLLARGTTSSGTGTAANALILSQTPDGALMGPVAATGEILITGTFALPEGLGSQGHAPGTADGREVDAVLVDGELPAHSSPTPIAASAAISTAKTTGEIIRPPAPEKGSRLMLTLAITAGVLALALVGVLIVAVVTGAFA